ncbi:ABC transporter permease [Peribacillus alkalitolerans]|uniref:ABC transporter permease subunit n=1 Tax=Peribacillus alkalitolerans TaxID=1550385 RepID=UPI0013D12059|nr:ABC transporter permease [Peribacillus alkalitolerans]
MVWQITKSLLVFLLILTGFILLLLLPREKEVIVFSAHHIETRYPFSFALYKDRIDGFIDYFQTEKGFGTVERTGVPIKDEVKEMLGRSMKIVIPAFILSVSLGMLFGVIRFYHRSRKRGKIQAALSWIFSSIPDFFLYIAIQYMFIKLISLGFPHFNLYGSDHWYSFILPLFAVSLFPFIHMSNFTTAALENEMGQEYLRTAYAKGLGTSKALVHMLWNCWSTLLNQTQLVMLYILSSLPIIEKLSGYNGAGYQLLQSILENEEARALAYMLPFLGFMFTAIVLAQVLKNVLVPKEARGI